MAFTMRENLPALLLILKWQLWCRKRILTFENACYQISLRAIILCDFANIIFKEKKGLQIRFYCIAIELICCVLQQTDVCLMRQYFKIFLFSCVTLPCVQLLRMPAAPDQCSRDLIACLPTLNQRIQLCDSVFRPVFINTALVCSQ